MMNHEKYEEQIHLFVDNDFNDRESEGLFEHLGSCESCRNFLRSLVTIRTLIGRQALVEVPISLDKRVLLATRPSHQKTNRRNLFSSLWNARISVPLPVASSLVFLIMLATLLIAPFFLTTATMKPPAQEDSPVLQELQRRGIISPSLLQR